MSRKLVVGDIHGNLKALNQVLERSDFDYDNDTLICLGDVCDGNDYTKQCIDKLLKVKNLILIKGNHDVWAIDWMVTGKEFPLWYNQGGRFTASSYDHDYETVPYEHIKLLEFKALPYYVDEDNRVFVHGGFFAGVPLELQDLHTFTWDRSLINHAKDHEIKQFKEIYIGHSTTQYYENRTTPVNYHNLWMMDTGAGWTGRLSIMDVDTKEVWSSDKDL